FGGTNSWENIGGVFIAPSTAIRTEVALQSSGPGVFWFDDIVLSPTNTIVDNGGFERGSMGWRLAAQAIVDSDPANAHSGTRCLKLVADAPWEGASHSPPIEPSHKYVVKG